METQIDQLAKILCNEVSSHDMPAGDSMIAALMLVGDIIGSTACPGCRE